MNGYGCITRTAFENEKLLEDKPLAGNVLSV